MKKTELWIQEEIFTFLQLLTKELQAKSKNPSCNLGPNGSKSKNKLQNVPTAIKIERNYRVV